MLYRGGVRIRFALAAALVLVACKKDGGDEVIRKPVDVVDAAGSASVTSLHVKAVPAAKGVVSAQLVIDSTGAVESVTPLAGTMGDASMTACYAGVFRTLSFPEPEDGKKVNVVYPIEFSIE